MKENSSKETVEPKAKKTRENVLEPDVQGTDRAELKVKLNPSANFDRNGFTSRKYKVNVRNLPRHYGFAVSRRLKFDSF